jgi:dCMP deaminase
MKTNWDKRFLELAEHISTWSKDRSRGVGAVIVNDDKRVVSFGYNGFPSGVDDSIEERHERPAKYDWTVHAEENAITNAARIGVSTMDCIMYLNLFPCARCAGNVINAGIKKVVVSKEPNYEDEKYGHEFRISRDKLIEADVEIEIIDEPRVFTIDVGSIPEDQIEEYIKKVKTQFIKK